MQIELDSDKVIQVSFEDTDSFAATTMASQESKIVVAALAFGDMVIKIETSNVAMASELRQFAASARAKLEAKKEIRK